jgi:HAD superfamily hydrolase (TIGR01509 family)
MLGRPAAIAYPALKQLADLPESPEELLAEARTRFFEQIDSAVHPTLGLFAILHKVEKRGLPRAVCTSSRRAYAERLLTQHGILAHFRALLTAEDVTRSKPDPEIYQKAATRLGVEAANLLVLEDSPAGVAAGTTAGAFTVGIPHEHSPAEALVQANLVVERLDDPRLLELLDA